MNRLKYYLIKCLIRFGFVKKPDFLARVISDHPDREHLPAEIILIVGGSGYHKWAYMRCPCGCGEVIMLSLGKTRRPNWSLRIDFFNRPTVHPSIHQTSGCKSHFFIRKGCITWCES